MKNNNTNFLTSDLIFKSPRPALSLTNNQTLPDFVLNHRIPLSNLDYPCFTDAITKETMSYTQLHKIVPQLASGLHNNFGIIKDDIVAMFVPNHINFGATMLAITDLGAKISPVNYVYTPNELANLLKLVKPKLLFTVPELLEISQKALEAPELSNVKLAFLNNEGCPKFPNIPNFKQILSTKQYPKLKFTNAEQSKEQVAAILFSSGTTGIPKGVMLSHFNLIANMEQVESILDPYYQPKNQFITVLPFYHLYAMMTDMLLVMHSGSSTNIMKKFDLKTYLEILDKNEIKLCFVAPPVIVQLAKNPIVENYKVSNLKAFFSAAAPLSKELEDEIFNKFGIKCTQGYGMSELSPLSHLNDLPEKRSGAAGYMVSNMEAIVVDVATGKRCGTNKRGELRLKGPNVMLGYYKNEQVTKDMFDEDGFMKTGDICYIDDDGYIYIVDRLKELIKVKGLQVAPAELEAVLLTHPEVADACVIGVHDNVAGELPKGFITLKNPNATNKSEIIKSIHRYFGEQLAHYKQLKGGIDILSEIPKSPSGKILRRKLRDLSNNNKPKL